MVMVDELAPTPPEHDTGCWSRLTTTSHIHELHAFAVRLRITRDRFRDDPSSPYYALTEDMRVKAMGYGAVFVPAAEQARMRAGKETNRGV